MGTPLLQTLPSQCLTPEEGGGRREERRGEEERGEEERKEDERKEEEGGGRYRWSASVSFRWLTDDKEFPWTH